MQVVKFDTDGGNIMVATPGRAEDMLRRVPTLVGFCKSLEILILDEVLNSLV
jgi:superfamily II DNA/RNA helicase